MLQIRELMDHWQQANDVPVDWFDRTTVKWHLTYDSWDDRFFVESVSGYLLPGVIYFSTREKAKEFLTRHQEQLKQMVQEIKQKNR